MAMRVAGDETLRADTTGVRAAVQTGRLAYADVPAALREDPVVVRYAVQTGRLAYADVVPAALREDAIVGPARRGRVWRTRTSRRRAPCCSSALCPRERPRAAGGSEGCARC